jgi:citrate lyase subunit beta/citryl-CoA lyase
MLQMKRSLLYVPADNEHMAKKAFSLESDCIIFDLEDSVAGDRKEIGRRILESLFIGEHLSGKEHMVRVNDIDSPFFSEDMRVVVKIKPHAVVLPKATEDALVAADVLLSGLEKEFNLPCGEIKLIPLIETAYGVCRAYYIARKVKRVCAIQFGAEDFTRDMEIRRTSSGNEIFFARNEVAVACRANGIEAIDTPFTDFNDDAGLEFDCNIAKSIGMKAKTCIHPKQIGIINRIFSPDQSEIAYAVKIIDQANLPENQKKGAFQFEGKMIDKPVLARAVAVLETAKKSGILK